MGDIAKRANEIRDKFCPPGDYDYSDIMDAIIAALTPPEGFVLVKAETLQDLASDAEEYVRTTEFRQSYIEDKLQSVREAQALLAARPEVK